MSLIRACLADCFADLGKVSKKYPDPWQTFAAIYFPLMSHWISTTLSSGQMQLPRSAAKARAEEFLGAIWLLFRESKYDLAKHKRTGGFRRWLKTVVQRALLNEAKRVRDRASGDDATRDSLLKVEAVDRLAEHFDHFLVYQCYREQLALYCDTFPEPWQQCVARDWTWGIQLGEGSARAAESCGGKGKAKTTLRALADQWGVPETTVYAFVKKAKEELKQRVERELARYDNFDFSAPAAEG